MYFKLGLGSLQMPRAFISGIPMSQDEYNDYIIKTNSIIEMVPNGKMICLIQLERTIDPKNFFNSKLEMEKD